jgi:hypothetical protein
MKFGKLWIKCFYKRWNQWNNSIKTNEVFNLKTEERGKELNLYFSNWRHRRWNNEVHNKR